MKNKLYTMKIKNMRGLTTEQINRELSYGAKFVVLQYTISILVMTFKNPSDVYFIRPGESRWAAGIKYSLLTFVLGWWGIPWGPSTPLVRCLPIFRAVKT